MLVCVLFRITDIWCRNRTVPDGCCRLTFLSDIYLPSINDNGHGPSAHLAMLPTADEENAALYSLTSYYSKDKYMPIDVLTNTEEGSIRNEINTDCAFAVIPMLNSSEILDLIIFGREQMRMLLATFGMPDRRPSKADQIIRFLTPIEEGASPWLVRGRRPESQ